MGLTIAIFLMGAEIGYLIYQNQKLRAVIANPDAYYRTLQRGETVPAVRTQTVDGQDLELQYSPDGPYTCLFWFSSSCESCTDNFAFWNTLYSDFAAAGIRFVGMCACEPEEARALQRSLGLNFPIVSATDQVIIDAYQGHLLPQTVLISPTGTIEHIWPGPLDENSRLDVAGTIAGVSQFITKGGETL